MIKEVPPTSQMRRLGKEGKRGKIYKLPNLQPHFSGVHLLPRKQDIDSVASPDVQLMPVFVRSQVPRCRWLVSKTAHRCPPIPLAPPCHLCIPVSLPPVLRFETWRFAASNLREHRTRPSKPARQGQFRDSSIDSREVTMASAHTSNKNGC